MKNVAFSSIRLSDVNGVLIGIVKRKAHWAWRILPLQLTARAFHMEGAHTGAW